MKSLDGHRCPACGGPLTYEVFANAARAGRWLADVPPAGDLALCVRCVALVLCKATVAIHGDVGERPGSHNFPGHEERMRAHEERMRRMGLVNDLDDEFDGELKDEALASSPA